MSVTSVAAITVGLYSVGCLSLGLIVLYLIRVDRECIRAGAGNPGCCLAEYGRDELLQPDCCGGSAICSTCCGNSKRRALPINGEKLMGSRN
jgi:hypothetical protein